MICTSNVQSEILCPEIVDESEQRKTHCAQLQQRLLRRTSNAFKSWPSYVPNY
jgi:hypothetical protein